MKMMFFQCPWKSSQHQLGLWQVQPTEPREINGCIIEDISTSPMVATAMAPPTSTETGKSQYFLTWNDLLAVGTHLEGRTGGLVIWKNFWWLFVLQVRFENTQLNYTCLEKFEKSFLTVCNMFMKHLTDKNGSSPSNYCINLMTIWTTWIYTSDLHTIGDHLTIAF